MSSDDKALEEASAQIVDSVLTETQKHEEVEDEFVKSLINSQQRQKTPSPPPSLEQVNKEEIIDIIDTNPIEESKPEHHEEKSQSDLEPLPHLEQDEPKIVAEHHSEQHLEPSPHLEQDFSQHEPHFDADPSPHLEQDFSEHEAPTEQEPKHVEDVVESHETKDEQELVVKQEPIDEPEDSHISASTHEEEKPTESHHTEDVFDHPQTDVSEPKHVENVVETHTEEEVKEPETEKADNSISVDDLSTDVSNIALASDSLLHETFDSNSAVSSNVESESKQREEEVAVAHQTVEETKEPEPVPRAETPKHEEKHEVVEEPVVEPPKIEPLPIDVPAPISSSEESKPVEQKEEVHQPAVQTKNVEPEQPKPEPATIAPAQTSNEDGNSSSSQQKKQDGLFKRVRKNYCAII